MAMPPTNTYYIVAPTHATSTTSSTPYYNGNINIYPPLTSSSGGTVSIRPDYSLKNVLEQLAYCSPKEFNYIIFEHIRKKWNVSYEDLPRDHADFEVIQRINQDGFILPTGIYQLPGGAKLYILKDDQYHIDDSEHKTVYKASGLREFNAFVNTSDVLDKFMEYIASLGLNKSEFMGLPIEMFLLWLIIEASKKDDEPPPPDVQLEFDFKINQLANIAA